MTQQDSQDLIRLPDLPGYSNLSGIPGGPHPIPSNQRRENAIQIAGLLRRHYGADLLALGVYGSLARSSDLPYSDIEMHCILQGDNLDTSFEWSTGAWKAEVDVYSPDVILRTAAEVDGDWSITHSQFKGVWALHDPTDLFPRLEALALSQPQASFDQAIREIIVGDIYELVGKARNTRISQDCSSLPFYTLLLAHDAARLVGLANRHLFTSSYTIFTETLSLPDRPDGHDALCQAAIHGDLSSPMNNLRWVEDYWLGIQTWAKHKNLAIEDSLEQLLTND